ncbi:MAG: hypothetical protein GX968_01885 [Tissierellia bacterium]|nr:hypothetical protein [Tissierellia bacterium]
MAINYSHFPHPILSKNRDDYIDSNFEVKLDIKEFAGRVLFLFEYLLDNHNLQNLLKEDKIEIIYRIECSETMYRRIFAAKESKYEISIEESYLNGKIEISSYIVAKRDLRDYNNPLFHPDYRGLSFDIDRANIIGIGEKFTIRLDKDIEELYNIPSIVTISRNENKNEKEMKINLDGDKINIILSEEDYVYQQNLISVAKYQPVLHAMIIMPALIHIFTLIKETNEEYIEILSEKRWFRVMDGVLRKMGMALDKDSIETHGAYKLAQIILDNPINRALGSLTMRGEDEEV